MEILEKVLRALHDLSNERSYEIATSLEVSEEAEIPLFQALEGLELGVSRKFVLHHDKIAEESDGLWSITDRGISKVTGK